MECQEIRIMYGRCEVRECMTHRTEDGRRMLFGSPDHKKYEKDHRFCGECELCMALIF